MDHSHTFLYPHFLKYPHLAHQTFPSWGEGPAEINGDQIYRHSQHKEILLQDVNSAAGHKILLCIHLNRGGQKG